MTRERRDEGEDNEEQGHVKCSRSMYTEYTED